MCERLYQSNVYLNSCKSRIVDIPAPNQIILDKTLFFPTGGGQPCDKGTIEGAQVIDVFESDGRIIHRMAAGQFCPDDPDNDIRIFEVGQDVTCILDWDRRFDHMQRHCGEHILSGIFFRDFGGINKGFHMGQDYMTIDIDLPALSKEQLASAELEANEVIWENAPVTVRFYANRQDAAGLPLRKQLTVDEDISVVCVGDEQHPADCVACCGTHPDSAGQIGLIKILKAESYKGMTRIYFEAGKRALLHYRKGYMILNELMERYSADESTLTDKIRIQDSKNELIRQELGRCKDALTDHEALSLLDDIAVPGQEEQSGAQIVIREYESFSIDDLQILAKKICAHSTNLFALISMPDTALLLCTSNTTPAGAFDCGKLVKENACLYKGRGGGNAAMARVVFESIEGLTSFLESLVERY